MKARIRLKSVDILPDLIDNKVEWAYMLHLEEEKRAGRILNFYIKPGSLRTGNGVYYKPDFMVITLTGEVEYHDTKGGNPDAAKGIAKMKMVKYLYPEFAFTVVHCDLIKGPKAHLPRRFHYTYRYEYL